MNQTSCIRVMLVDDHAVVRAGYRFLLSYNDDIEVIAEAGNGEEALELLEHTRPDVLVMDLTMPGMHGFNLLQEVLSRIPACRILVFTMHENSAFAEQALRFGASGYLSKNSAPEELTAAIRQIATGNLYIDAELARSMVVQRTREKGARFAELTSREYQILCLFADGRSIDEIAASLSLSNKTIANYLTLIKDKLQVGSTQELVKLPISQGLVTLSYYGASMLFPAGNTLQMPPVRENFPPSAGSLPYPRLTALSIMAH